LSPRWLTAQLAGILEADAGYGRTTTAPGQRVQVEFVSANPTGPLNVVSARAAAVGDTLVRLLRAAGHDARGEFYVNDAGNQVDLLARSIEARWLAARGEDVAIPEGGYHGEYVVELAARLARDQDLDAMSPAARRDYLRDQGLSSILATQRRDLERFGVTFDRWFHESELYTSGELDRTHRLLAEGGWTEEREGAVWFRSSALGDDEDRVIVRTDGRPTYLLADIAYHASKHARGFEHVIDLLGPDHHGHVARMEAAAEALGYGRSWLEILIVQQVNLLRGGQPVKMSKRAGELIGLEELEAEVGRDPARFFFLMRRSNAHLDFDLDLARQQNEENPCFYVQYAHARIASVLERASERGTGFREPSTIDLGRLGEEEELALAKQLVALPEVVRGAAEAREPHRMTVYLREVAAHFHRFYHHQRIVGVEEELSQARLALIRATQLVLRNGLELIGLDAPERM
ncbi:MAG: arginine--tRNA ligase, partial [Candidatus Eiseniibacteriota bacterium]